MFLSPLTFNYRRDTLLLTLGCLAVGSTSQPDAGSSAPAQSVSCGGSVNGKASWMSSGGGRRASVKLPAGQRV